MLRLAVLSDLHVYEGDGSEADKPSFLATGAPEDLVEWHPFTGLSSLIAREGLASDFLLCGGDMGDKASPPAIMYAWQKLHATASQLGAQLLATAGNHDMDSRHNHNDFDAKGILQGLVPSFPTGAPGSDDVFWARNFALIEHEFCRIVILNSSAYHGHADEFSHGRVATRTISTLRQRLREASLQRINILLCHHHPYRFADIDVEDYSEMKGGAQLLELLSDATLGDWLIVHGHKHYPRLCYAPGGAGSPVVFSAGSFSATLYPDLGARARNQFYLFEIPTDAAELGLVGTFRSWDWIPARGWQPAQDLSGLPGSGGFGLRDSPSALARQIATFIASNGSQYVTWEEILTEFPRLRYILPDDRTNMFTLLERQNIDVLRGDVATIQFSKRPGL